jgi:hypothetical protein
LEDATNWAESAKTIADEVKNGVWDAESATNDAEEWPMLENHRRVLQAKGRNKPDSFSRRNELRIRGNS